MPRDEIVTQRAVQVLESELEHSRRSWNERWAECPSCGAVYSNRPTLERHARECHWLRRDVDDVHGRGWMLENAHNR